MIENLSKSTFFNMVMRSYADNPKMSLIYVVTEMLDFRVD